MRKCLSCGALNQDSNLSCGVCGRSFINTSSLPPSGTRYDLHLGGLIGLVFGVALLLLGFFMLGSNSMAAGLFGGFFMFVGLIFIVFIVGWFRGLPYRPK